MIRISLPVLALLYLVGLLATVMGAWLLYEWRAHRRERDAFRHVLRCTLCGFEFEDRTDAELPCCPGCRTRNERTRPAQL